MSIKSEANKGARRTIELSVFVAEGIDALNPKDETIINLTVYDDMKLGTIHQTVCKVLQLPADDKMTYCPEFTKNALDFERTFKELQINNWDRLALESGKKKRKTNAGYEPNQGGNEDVLELICTTRIFDNDSSLSSPIRRVRVVVLAAQLCADLISDVSSLWGRTGLKFKCGRTVLQGGKTFEELGVENGAEIVVTGGRG